MHYLVHIRVIMAKIKSEKSHKEFDVFNVKLSNALVFTIKHPSLE